MRLIVEAHCDAQRIRRAKGLPPWDFGDGTAMGDERCAMCKDAGFPNVLAHYKAIPAGMSHNGHAIPPLCFDHKHGRVPPFIASAQHKSEKPVEPVKPEANTMPKEETEVCGCGRPLPHKGRCEARRANTTLPPRFDARPTARGATADPPRRNGSSLLGGFPIGQWIEDLRGKRDKLDAAIRALEELERSVA